MLRFVWRRQKFDSTIFIFLLCFTVTGTAFEAGTDTTAITLLWFIVAMLTYPECQKRAQNEIDGGLGVDGTFMPGYEHMNDLPYCFALTKEVFR